ncbi:5759_t:CDS:2 [Paraglomus occultum]|uniref:RNA polymerase II transcription factor B subunit 3 n=1 Tax=Paraglomus occultum TaxID=144539 RepID=A0A9N9A4N1_9GLOM|nr:5759_t:CDS:2 [Paraglomus occultum]
MSVRSSATAKSTPKKLASNGTNRQGEASLSNDNADEVCPICKNNRYLSPDMKLLVSECYHKMCESCIDRLFANGAGPCPICGQVVRKVNFAIATFEDLLVEKEIKIRKRIAHHFNKRQEDFPSLKEYNDYLEEVENIAWNLINGISLEETEAKIKAYQQENHDLIAANAQRMLQEEKLAKLVEEQEQKEKQSEFEKYQQTLEEERKLKATLKDEFIEELATSDASPEKILAEKKAAAAAAAAQRSSKQTAEHAAATPYGIAGNSVGMWLGLDREQMDDSMKDYDPVATEYADIDGYTLREKYYDPFTEVSALSKTGGFNIKFVHERALQAAFSGICDV